MIQIADFKIGKEHPCFIIAELSANHNGSLETAIETVRAAKAAGADCIKLQTYTADTLTLDSRKPDFIVKGGTLWDGQSLHELYQKAYTPWDWHARLFEVAKEEGLICFSSPFDPTAVDLLEELNVPAYKIASFEITDIPLIRYVASKGKPIIISTGIAGPDDIELAVQTCRDAGNEQIILLKCTSAYPAKIEDANLKTIPDLAERYGVLSGLSDHTMGSVAPVVSVAFGGRVIEKHFILDRSVGGPDAAFSMDQQEFRQMVEDVRNAEAAMGLVDYSASQKASRGFARSLYVAENLAQGEIITENHVRSVRPGYGAHPKHLDDILGKTVNRDLEKGDRFSLEFVN